MRPQTGPTGAHLARAPAKNYQAPPPGIAPLARRAAMNFASVVARMSSLPFARCGRAARIWPRAREERPCVRRRAKYTRTVRLRRAAMKR